MLAIFLAFPADAPQALGLDPDEFRAFYTDALPRIYGYFLHRCGGSAPVAEDLTQETFLGAVRELKQGKRIAAPLPWLYGIARHKLLDHYRREARDERTLAAVVDVAETEESPQAADDPGRASTALAAVVASQRAALVLCYVDGLSVPEAATALGRSIEAVESLLARGRQSFKRAYTGTSS